MATQFINQATENLNAVKGEKPMKNKSINHAAENLNATKGEEPMKNKSINHATENLNATKGEEPMKNKSINHATENLNAVKGEKPMKNKSINHATENLNATKGEKIMKKGTNKTVTQKHSSNCISVDGRYYIFTNADGAKIYLEIGKDISEEIVLSLIEVDSDINLDDRYASEARDPYFDAMMNSYLSQRDPDYFNDPWNSISDPTYNPENIVFQESNSEDPINDVIDDILEKECTQSERNLFYDCFGMGCTLEEIRQTEASAKGKLVSEAAMSLRKKKLLDKVKSAVISWYSLQKDPKKD